MKKLCSLILFCSVFCFAAKAQMTNLPVQVEKIEHAKGSSNRTENIVISENYIKVQLYRPIWAAMEPTKKDIKVLELEELGISEAVAEGVSRGTKDNLEKWENWSTITRAGEEGEDEAPEDSNIFKDKALGRGWIAKDVAELTKLKEGFPVKDKQPVRTRSYRGQSESLTSRARKRAMELNREFNRLDDLDSDFR